MLFQRHTASITTKNTTVSNKFNPHAFSGRRRGRRDGSRLGKKHRNSNDLVFLVVASAMILLIMGVVFGRGALPLPPSPPPKTHNQFELYSEQASECRPLESFEDISYTLVTQLSEDRLWMMEYHCERYQVNEGHPMSIAVWTPKTLEETRQTLQQLRCDLNYLSVSVLHPSLSLEADDYPVNQLRNLALESVETTHVIYIDVDFWTSQYMYDILMKPNVRQALWEDLQLILIIPSFMLFNHCENPIDCREDNLKVMPFTMPDLLWMVKNKHGSVFDPTNKGGHGSTKYHVWLNEQSKLPPGNLVDINCLISKRYEPFVVVRYCRDLPPFQSAFTGYGKNKMTWMMHVIRRGYALKQVGGVYLAHYPHLESVSRVKWNKTTRQLPANVGNATKDLNTATLNQGRRLTNKQLPFKKKAKDLNAATLDQVRTPTKKQTPFKKKTQDLYAATPDQAQSLTKKQPPFKKKKAKDLNAATADQVRPPSKKQWHFKKKAKDLSAATLDKVRNQTKKQIPFQKKTEDLNAEATPDQVRTPKKKQIPFKKTKGINAAATPDQVRTPTKKQIPFKKKTKGLNVATPDQVRTPTKKKMPLKKEGINKGAQGLHGTKKEGNLNLSSKRAQVDQLFVAFREWLYREVPDQTRVPLCWSAQDDDAKLWIDRTNHTKPKAPKRENKH